MEHLDYVQSGDDVNHCWLDEEIQNLCPQAPYYAPDTQMIKQQIWQQFNIQLFQLYYTVLHLSVTQRSVSGYSQSLLNLLSQTVALGSTNQTQSTTPTTNTSLPRRKWSCVSDTPRKNEMAITKQALERGPTKKMEERKTRKHLEKERRTGF